MGAVSKYMPWVAVGVITWLLVGQFNTAGTATPKLPKGGPGTDDGVGGTDLDRIRKFYIDDLRFRMKCRLTEFFPDTAPFLIGNTPEMIYDSYLRLYEQCIKQV
jgi:hypothetical protein